MPHNLKGLVYKTSKSGESTLNSHLPLPPPPLSTVPVSTGLHRSAPRQKESSSESESESRGSWPAPSGSWSDPAPGPCGVHLRVFVSGIYLEHFCLDVLIVPDSSLVRHPFGGVPPPTPWESKKVLRMHVKAMINRAFIWDASKFNHLD